MLLWDYLHLHQLSSCKTHPEGEIVTVRSWWTNSKPVRNWLFMGNIRIEILFIVPQWEVEAWRWRQKQTSPLDPVGPSLKSWAQSSRPRLDLTDSGGGFDWAVSSMNSCWLQSRWNTLEKISLKTLELPVSDILMIFWFLLEIRSSRSRSVVDAQFLSNTSCESDNMNKQKQLLRFKTEKQQRLQVKITRGVIY